MAVEVLVSSPGSCDSLITVTALEPASITFGSLVLQGCESEPLTYQGITISPGTSLEFFLTNAAGCDSVLTVTALEPLPSSSSSETTSLCIGASIEVLGQTVTSPGVYTAVFDAANGCDSTHTVYVELEAGPPLVMPEDFQIELGETVTLNPSVSPFGQLNFTWSSDQAIDCPDGTGNGCANPPVTPLQSTSFNLTITDVDGCQSSGIVAIEVVCTGCTAVTFAIGIAGVTGRGASGSLSSWQAGPGNGCGIGNGSRCDGSGY